MSKQTAVDYLVEQLIEYDFSPRENTYLIEIPSWIFKEKLEKAKAMEREQMIDFAQMWQDSPIEKYDCKQDLYNEIYKGGEQ